MSQAKYKYSENTDNKSGRLKIPDIKRSNLLGGLFFITVMISLAVAVFVLYNWANDAQRQPIAKLVITGDRYFTSDNDIRQAILALGEPSTLINQDVNVLRLQIERLPWIKRAKIKKEWPDKLRIDILEYKPVVKWNKNNLLDDEANVFSLPPERMIKLPLAFLTGNEGQEKIALSAYKEMHKLIGTNGRVLVSASMSERNAWTLSIAFLENGVPQLIKIELGQKDYLGRLNRFLALFSELKKSNPEQRIINVDMRYETGVSVIYEPLVESLNTN